MAVISSALKYNQVIMHIVQIKVQTIRKDQKVLLRSLLDTDDAGVTH